MSDQVRQVRKAIVDVYRALRGTREGRYSFLLVGITAKPIGCSCCIPCLHASEIHSMLQFKVESMMEFDQKWRLLKYVSNS